MEMKKNEVAIHISDKIDFQRKPAIKNKEHFTMINGSIQQKDITFVNTYTLNVVTPKYIKQILTDKKERLTVRQ